MGRNPILSAAWTLIGSALLGCASESSEYRPVPLTVMADPLVPEKNFAPWRPPRQMAAFVHPHEDALQGVMIGGHWLMVPLGEGNWYFDEDAEREPLPDAEASAEDVRRALSSITVPRDAVIPYRPKEEKKP